MEENFYSVQVTRGEEAKLAGEAETIQRNGEYNSANG